MDVVGTVTVLEHPDGQQGFQKDPRTHASTRSLPDGLFPTNTALFRDGHVAVPRHHKMITCARRGKLAINGKHVRTIRASSVAPQLPWA